MANSAWASMGSPSGVPVPCASRASMSPGARRALASAWRMTRCWDGPLGAVRPLEAPSWLMAEPRRTASTGWPLRCASESRSTRTMPTPSARVMPSAASENALQRPSWARARCRLNAMNGLGVVMTVAPPATARVLSPLRSDWQARCSATSEEEQAVSTVTAGPSRPNTYDRRPDSTLGLLPVTMWPSAPSPAPRPYSW
ncbi:hypothetical protein SAZ_40845 [Streptomyces noursei ZPM]|nr:hypothetical protein SAZ_40845 [Streptomyces noursei ZPM]